MFSFPLQECHWCLLEPPCEVKAKLLRRVLIDFSTFYETVKGYTLSIHWLHYELSFMCVCDNQNMFSDEMKWKD